MEWKSLIKEKTNFVVKLRKVSNLVRKQNM